MAVKRAGQQDLSAIYSAACLNVIYTAVAIPYRIQGICIYQEGSMRNSCEREALPAESNIIAGNLIRYL